MPETAEERQERTVLKLPLACRGFSRVGRRALQAPALARVGTGEQAVQWANTLSGGQQQRAAITWTLV